MSGSEQKQCAACRSPFTVRPEDLAFYNKISPVVDGKKHQIPPPTRCPRCRTQRRLAFRNERTLYQRKCDLCAQQIISTYSPDKPYTVYCSDCWWGDGWAAQSFGREIDFSRSFLEQFHEVSLATPKIALANSNLENSSYVNQTVHLKNCYLIFSSVDSEDCYYGLRMNRDKNCVDGLVVEGSELAYECIMGENLYECFYSIESTSCSSSSFLFDCQNCQNCFMCWNLRGKEYHIRNEPLTRAAYEAAIPELREETSRRVSLGALRAEFQEHVRREAVHRAARILSCENCVGDNLYDSKNSYYCFQGGNLEDCAYSVLVNFSKDTFDTNNSYQGELVYETCTSGIQSTNVIFSHDGWPNHHNVMYSSFCPNSHWLVGCAGLKRGKHAILNKEYDEKTFNELYPRVVALLEKHGEWGEFFPSRISPFGYNETAAQEHFPLSEADARGAGFPWCSFVAPPPAAKMVIDPSAVPDDIQSVTDEILQAALRCETSGRPFRVVQPELSFYRRFGIPLPTQHPDVRHSKRMALCNKRSLWKRACDACSAAVFSSFEPDRPETILCDKCYEARLYNA